MRVLILGVSGLIGHKLLQELSTCCEVFGTLHKPKNRYGNLPMFSGQNVIANIDISDFEILKGVLYTSNPDCILNCVGITKRKTELNDISKALIVNSLFPHQLANWARINHKRVIHFSTDCVFDGKIGSYNEKSLTNAEDIYGRTKALGEIYYKHTLTIRSSFIGQELFGKTELLEWFLAQEGKQIRGYTDTFYSGVSTLFMARTIKNLILKFPNLSGIYNLAIDNPISKYELLCLAKEAFNLNIDIVPETGHVHSPTLNASKLKRKTKLIVPEWNEMMNEMSLQKEFYVNL